MKKLVAMVSGVAAVIGFGVVMCPSAQADPSVPCPYNASVPGAQKQYFDQKTAELVAYQNDINTRVLGPLSPAERDAWAKSPAGVASVAKGRQIEDERDNLPPSCSPSQPVSSASHSNPAPVQPAPAANPACPYDMNTQSGRDAFQQAIVASSQKVGSDERAYGPSGNPGLATNDFKNEKSTSDMILACQGINAPPQPTGSQPDPNRLVPPPGGWQTPAQMTKADCVKLENDLHDKRTSVGLDLAGIAADVPVDMAVASALGICGINGVNDLPDDVDAAMGGLMGTAAKAAGG